ncbi:hypothetical protein NMG60_11016132 [Bertholletia excelsa]
MKQRTSAIASLTDEEAEVCAILLDLRNRISESETRHGFGLQWGAKRRRSGAGLNPPPTRRLCTSTAPHGKSQGETKTRPRPEFKTESTSPTTPLSFSPSETDDKTEQYSRNRTREEWLEIMEDLVQERELIRRNIETMTSYCKTLRAANLELKALKKELSSRPAIPHSGIRRSLNFVKEISIERQGRPQVPYVGHQQPCILAQTAKMDFCSSFPFGLGKVEHTPPRGFPDLNLNLEEALLNDPLPPSDHFRALADQRARAADARRRRLIKIREKNGLTAVKASRRSSPFCCASSTAHG